MVIMTIISHLARLFPLRPQADHISRVPHAAGGLPHGHPRLPPQIWKLWVNVLIRRRLLRVLIMHAAQMLAWVHKLQLYKKNKYSGSMWPPLWCLRPCGGIWKAKEPKNTRLQHMKCRHCTCTSHVFYRWNMWELSSCEICVLHPYFLCILHITYK